MTLATLRATFLVTLHDDVLRPSRDPTHSRIYYWGSSILTVKS